MHNKSYEIKITEEFWKIMWLWKLE